MPLFRLLPLVAAMALSACVTSGESEVDDDGNLVELPEGLAEVAAPYQDTRHVRIMPEDGCYWYRHRGPVEDTYLPLRTRDGRPICSRAQ